MKTSAHILKIPSYWPCAVLLVAYLELLKISILPWYHHPFLPGDGLIGLMPAKSSEEVEDRVGKKRTRKIASSKDMDTGTNDFDFDDDDDDNDDDDGDGDDHSDSDIVSSTECSNSEQDEIEPPERLDLDKCLVYHRSIRVEIRLEDVDPVCFNANASMFD